MPSNKADVQAGQADITTDGNGDGTVAITLKNPIDGEYAILMSIREADNTGILDASSITAAGFTIGVDNSAVLNGTLTVSWVAVKSTQDE